MTIDEETSKKDKDRASETEEFKVPKFKDVVNYVWDQMQKRKKGSNAKHRFVIGNQVLQFHPLTYQEVSINSSVLKQDARGTSCFLYSHGSMFAKITAIFY